MTEKFFILKAKDCFGDIWPIPLPAGICGMRFASKDEAKKFLDTKKSTVDGRREMRLSGGWVQNTVKCFQIHEIISLD